MNPSHIYVFFETENFRDEIQQQVKNYPLEVKQHIQSISEYDPQDIDGTVVVEINDNLDNVHRWLPHYSREHQIPVIAVIKEDAVDDAWQCGNMGIDGVITVGQLPQIEKIIKEVMNKFTRLVTLADISIDLQDYPSETIRDILKTTENNYLLLSSKKDIEQTVRTRMDNMYLKFRKHQLIPPKKLLYHLKARHALNLMEMEVNQYSLKQIVYKSGFLNYIQFRRCIQHIFNRSPKDIRRMVKDFGAKQVWEEFGSLTKSLKI